MVEAGSVTASGGASGGVAVDETHDPPYFLVWGVLFILTAGEVGYAFLSLPKIWLVLGLLFMAVWKAMLVALYYMHLRFEPQRLWMLVISPLPLVVILLMAVLTEF